MKEIRVHVIVKTRMNRQVEDQVVAVLEDHTFDRTYLAANEHDAIQQAQADYPAGSFTVGATIREVADSGGHGEHHDHGAHGSAAEGGHGGHTPG